jgi:hypothetical protein
MFIKSNSVNMARPLEKYTFYGGNIYSSSKILLQSPLEKIRIIYQFFRYDKNIFQIHLKMPSCK